MEYSPYIGNGLAVSVNPLTQLQIPFYVDDLSQTFTLSILHKGHASPAFDSMKSFIISLHDYIKKEGHRHRNTQIKVNSFLRLIDVCHISMEVYIEKMPFYLYLYKDIIHFLYNRHDLIENYLGVETLEERMIEVIINHFKSNITKDSLFDIDVSDLFIEQLINITKKQLQLFSPDTDDESIRHFFFCIQGKPLRPAENGLFSYFIRKMKDAGIFKYDAMQIIGRNRLLSSSTGRKVLTSQDISKAAEQYNRNSSENDVCKRIDTAIKEIRLHYQSSYR